MPEDCKIVLEEHYPCKLSTSWVLRLDCANCKSNRSHIWLNILVSAENKLEEIRPYHLILPLVVQDKMMSAKESKKSSQGRLPFAACIVHLILIVTSKVVESWSERPSHLEHELKNEGREPPCPSLPIMTDNIP